MSESRATNSSPNGGDWFEIAAKVRVQVTDPDLLTKAAIAEAQGRTHGDGGPTVEEIRSDLAEAIMELVDPIVLIGNLPGAEPSDGQVSVGTCAPFRPPA